MDGSAAPGAILVTGPFGVGEGLAFEDAVVDHRGATADVAAAVRELARAG